jgi:hypothetical protein
LDEDKLYINILGLAARSKTFVFDNYFMWDCLVVQKSHLSECMCVGLYSVSVYVYVNVNVICIEVQSFDHLKKNIWEMWNIFCMSIYTYIYWKEKEK